MPPSCNCVPVIHAGACVFQHLTVTVETMFDVLVYLYETYYRPDACPDSEALVKKLSAVGFEEEEICKAMGWLTDLAETTNEFSMLHPQQTSFSAGFRIYVDR